ncbi:dihydrodipicolinate synthase [Bordetella ansorpii]|uniref:Dihydrodipicolinate synthase n=1 Tax=Bordetella ansorpii TaxID=288768 RepID=A0A157SRG7_9BORD|nr:dihydrodipicolinate synthase family protein [Bordetella ansorpii]SAI73098.1 dihydrodipicolinate synthase [Bordetella ansorpii]
MTSSTDIAKDIDNFVPLVTPFDADGRVCSASVARLLASVRHSTNGVIPCLTSGEGWRLTDAQWASMLALTFEHAHCPVIVGIERRTTEEVLALAKAAKGQGANAIMLTTPFGTSVSQAAMLEHFRRVHDAADLDIYIYNESNLSGNETELDTLLAIGALPRVVGIKDSPDQPRSADEVRSLRECGMKYLLGWEHQLATGLPADGCVVSLANLEPELCRLASCGRHGLIHAEVERLSQIYQLDRDDWYRHIKAELAARGIIQSQQLVEQ